VGNKHQQLRSLCRLRYRYVQNQTRVKNRIKGHLSSFGIQIPPSKELSHWSGNFINWLRSIEFYHDSARDYLDFCIDDLIEQRKKIADITKLLRQYIKENGIGTLIRKDPALLLCFNQFCQRMKKQEAIIRIAKKLLNRIRHVWKNEES